MALSLEAGQVPGEREGLIETNAQMAVLVESGGSCRGGGGNYSVLRGICSSSQYTSTGACSLSRVLSTVYVARVAVAVQRRVCVTVVGVRKVEPEHPTAVFHRPSWNGDAGDVQRQTVQRTKCLLTSVDTVRKVCVSITNYRRHERQHWNGSRDYPLPLKSLREYCTFILARRATANSAVQY